jgi:hypothetical protein
MVELRTAKAKLVLWDRRSVPLGSSRASSAKESQDIDPIRTSSTILFMRHPTARFSDIAERWL